MAHKERTKESLLRELRSLQSKINELETAQSVYKQEARSAKVFRTIADKANYGAAIADLDGNLVYINEVLAGMHGYSPDEVIGENLSIFHNEDQMKEVDKIITALKKKGSIASREVWHKKKDGTVFPTMMNTTVIRNEAGKPLFLSTTVVDITEHKMAEAAIRESEEKWRSLVENAPDIIIMLDHEGVIQFINRTVTGLDSKDVIGKKQLDYIEPEYRKLVSDTVENVLKTGNYASYEIKGVGSHAGKAWYSTQIGPIKRDGQIIGVTLFVTDITERKHIEDALKESEEKLRVIFENVIDGILLADIKSKKLYTCNSTMCNMLGYNTDEIRKLGVQDIHPEEGFAGVIEKFEEQAQGKVTLAKDVPVKRKDGSVFYADINSSPIVLTGKTYLMGIFRDITERKQTEGALRESEEKYRLITENTSDFIAVMEFSGIYTYISPSHAQFGYKPEDLVGRSGLDMLHPEDRKNLLPLIKKYAVESLKGVLHGRPENVHEFIEFRFPDASGNWHNMETTANLIKSLKGKGFSILLISRDVTNRKKIELEMERQRKALDVTNKELHAKVEEVQKAMGHIKRLEGLVPICARCKKIRVDSETGEAWVSLEKYISDKTEASLTHGLCPECAQKLYKKKQEE